MATTITRKELKIYRGKYAEIMDPLTVTENMAIYFAWDTREIFVGNEAGVKVPYNGGESLTARQVTDLIDQQTASELLAIRNFLTMNNQQFKDAMTALTTIETYNSNLSTTVASQMSDIIATWEDDGLGADLGDNYYNKTEVNERDAAVLAKLNELRNNVYSKTIIDSKVLAALEDNISPTELSEYVDQHINPYLSIQILDDIVYDDAALLARIGAFYHSSIDVNGIYRINSNNGYIILNVFGTTISKIDINGVVQIYTEVDTVGSWINYIDPLVVTSINGEVPDPNDEENLGNVTLNASHIEGNETTRDWNNIYPQTLDGVYVSAINPLNRGTVGDYSIAFGAGAQAESYGSIAIGEGSHVNFINSIQLGTTNVDDDLNESLLHIWQHELLNRKTGKIPTTRIIERFDDITLILTTETWNGTTMQYIIDTPGMRPEALVWVAPRPDSYTLYGEFGIRAVSQDIDTLTFECDEIPTSNIAVNITWRV